MPVPAHSVSDRPDGEINTLLGKGSEFEGKLTFEGTVRIDDKLSGEIFSDDVLVVGEGAHVSAEIEVGVIIVEGNVTGNIRAKRAVELHAPARVRGNIETPSLYVDKGVIFEGNCRMEGAGQPRPTTLNGLATAAGPKPTVTAQTPTLSAAPPANPPKK